MAAGQTCKLTLRRGRNPVGQWRSARACDVSLNQLANATCVLLTRFTNALYAKWLLRSGFLHEWLLPVVTTIAVEIFAPVESLFNIAKQVHEENALPSLGAIST